MAMQEVYHNIHTDEYSIHIEDCYIKLFYNYIIDPYLEQKTDDFGMLIKKVMHTHICFEMFVCLSGSIQIKTEKNIIELSTGDILVVPPMCKHVRLPLEKDNEHYVYMFSIHHVPQANCHSVYRKLAVLLQQEQPIYLHGNDTMAAEAKLLHEWLNQSMGNCAVLPLVTILLNVTNKLQERKQTAIQTPVVTDETTTTKDLEHIIYSRFMLPIEPAQVAQILNVSQRTLDRLCHRRYGMSYRNVIIDRRLTVAIEMLKTGERGIEDIGYSVGFTSYLNFIRAFTKKYGVPPTAYRENT